MQSPPEVAGMKRLIVLFVMAAAAGCGAGPDTRSPAAAIDVNARAGVPVGTTGTRAGTVEDSGPAFPDWVREAAMHNAAAVELGKLAMARGSSTDVREYGATVIRDHGAIGAALVDAVRGQMTLPTTRDERHRAVATVLHGLSGLEFDREFVAAMIDEENEIRELLVQVLGGTYSERAVSSR